VLPLRIGEDKLVDIIDPMLGREVDSIVMSDVQKEEHFIENGFTVSSVDKSNDELWLKMGRLRADVYVDERSFLSPEALDNNGAEYDEYDDSADHFVALSDKGDVIGTIRIIHRPEGGKLPCEHIFNLDLKNSSREVSRIMVDSKVPRRRQSMVTMSLLRAAIKAAPEDEDEAYAIIEPSMFRYLESIVGVKLETLADPRYIEEYNSVNEVVSMRPHDMTSQIHERDKLRRPAIGLPETLAPFFEYNSTARGIGRVALEKLGQPSPEQFDRNLGFISQAEHEHLQKATVAIAGAGGDGGELAVTLAQLGVGRFRIADPEVFEVNNLNRQAGSSYSTIGRNKAEVIAGMIKDINPYAEVEVYNVGVTSANVEEFIQGSDLVIDESEYTHPEIGVMIARKAREHNIPDLMTLNVGFGSYTTSFSPNGKTFEDYMGLDPNASLDVIANATIDISKWVPHIPSYADISSFKKVANQEVPTPSVSTGVKMGVAVASTQAIAHLLKEISPNRSRWIDFAPRGKSVDAIDGTRTIRFPAFHFYTSFAIAALRTKLGMNPPAGY